MLMVCDTECDEGTFGIECAMRCHCERDAACDRVSGVCPGGLCADAWLGTSCQTGEHLHLVMTHLVVLKLRHLSIIVLTVSK